MGHHKNCPRDAVSRPVVVVACLPATVGFLGGPAAIRAATLWHTGRRWRQVGVSGSRDWAAVGKHLDSGMEGLLWATY